MDHLMKQMDEQGNYTKLIVSMLAMDFGDVCHYHGPRLTARSFVVSIY